jgi:hypothetical protein
MGPSKRSRCTKAVPMRRSCGPCCRRSALGHCVSCCKSSTIPWRQRCTSHDTGRDYLRLLWRGDRATLAGVPACRVQVAGRRRQSTGGKGCPVSAINSTGSTKPRLRRCSRYAHARWELFGFLGMGRGWPDVALFIRGALNAIGARGRNKQTGEYRSLDSRVGSAGRQDIGSRGASRLGPQGQPTDASDTAYLSRLQLPGPVTMAAPSTRYAD